jgi:hypothetical protein
VYRCAVLYIAVLHCLSLRFTSSMRFVARSPL